MFKGLPEFALQQSNILRAQKHNDWVDSELLNINQGMYEVRLDYGYLSKKGRLIIQIFHTHTSALSKFRAYEKVAAELVNEKDPIFISTGPESIINFLEE